MTEKFSNEEALFAQTFATEKEGKKFSKQGSDKNYEDAKVLLEKLKEKNIDWLEIDWGKVDFDNANSISKLEVQLDKAARKILESQVQSSKDGKGFMEKYKKMLMPLAVSLAFILGAENINIGKVGFHTSEAEASERLPSVGKMDIDRAEKIFKSVFKGDISREQAEQIAEAYRSVNEEQLQKIIKIGSKTMSQGSFDTQEIIDFLTSQAYVSQANQIFRIVKTSNYSTELKTEVTDPDKQYKDSSAAVDEKYEKEKDKMENSLNSVRRSSNKSYPNARITDSSGKEKDIGELISTEEIKTSDGNITIFYGKNGEYSDIGMDDVPPETQSLLKKSANGKFNINLTEKGKKTYEGTFVNEIQEEQRLTTVARHLAGFRNVYFKALEKAKQSGNKKAEKAIQRELDKQKQNAKELYGDIFIK